MDISKRTLEGGNIIILSYRICWYDYTMIIHLNKSVIVIQDGDTIHRLVKDGGGKVESTTDGRWVDYGSDWNMRAFKYFKSGFREVSPSLERLVSKQISGIAGKEFKYNG